MNVVADAHRLPLRDGSVDLVLSNPPYPGNGVWADDYGAGLTAAATECARLAGRLGRTAIGTDIDIGQLRGRRW